MEKQELEARLGYEITWDGWIQLEKMYMACNLEKNEFANLVKQGARVYEVEQESYEYKGVVIRKNAWTSRWEISNWGIESYKSFRTLDSAKDYIRTWEHYVIR